MTSTTPSAPAQAPHTIVSVTAGVSEPSSTRLLADRLTERASSLAASNELTVHVHTIELRALANDITAMTISNHRSPQLRDAIDTLRDADAVVASTPVYQAGPSGLFTEFFQLLDTDLLIGTPVLLAGTGGSERHSLVIDDQLRGMFAYLRTLTTPTAVYATPNDWQDRAFQRRVTRAATELVLLMRSGLRTQLRGDVWNSYQHNFDSAATPTTHPTSGVNLDSELMRLAAGGSATAG